MLTSISPNPARVFGLYTALPQSPSQGQREKGQRERGREGRSRTHRHRCPQRMQPWETVRFGRRRRRHSCVARGHDAPGIPVSLSHFVLSRCSCNIETRHFSQQATKAATAQPYSYSYQPVLPLRPSRGCRRVAPGATQSRPRSASCLEPVWYSGGLLLKCLQLACRERQLGLLSNWVSACLNLTYATSS